MNNGKPESISKYRTEYIYLHLVCCGYRRLIIYKQSDALYIVEHAQLRRVIHRFLFQIHYSLLQRKSLGNESFQRVGDVEVRFLVANLLPSITSNSFPILK